MARMTPEHHLRTIGELARLTGLPVTMIRFWSDSGLVPPAGRTDAGYRLYDGAAPARLELVHTLRELDVDLATVRRVLARELTVAEVAAAHAAALDAQIRVLRLRRAVLAAVARRQADPEEMNLMHKLARLSAEERCRIVEDFVDHVFDGLDADPGILTRMRQSRPELPDDATPAQLEAWIELAGLVSDEDFRRRIRGMAERSSTDRAAAPADPGTAERVNALVAERAGAALDAGLDPASPQARAVLDELVAALAAAHGRPEDDAYRAWLAETIETFADARAERYWQLLGTINGWPSRPSSSPAWGWLLGALRAGADG
ncbi:MAG: MerR family transcriptional regulator [Solirubrobacteraceae bacterium]